MMTKTIEPITLEFRDTKIAPMPSDLKIVNIATINNTVYVAAENGVYKIVNDELVPLYINKEIKQ